MVIKSLNLAEENIIKSIRNLLRLGKEYEEIKQVIFSNNYIEYVSDFKKYWHIENSISNRK